MQKKLTMVAAFVAFGFTIPAEAQGLVRGRTSAIKRQIAAHLNNQGVFPPNAMMAPYTVKDVRIRTQVSLALNATMGLLNGELRQVKFRVPSLGGDIKGVAKALTPFDGGGAKTIVSDAHVTSTPWRIPLAPTQ